MIEFFQHLFGLCPDQASHINLLTIFTTGALSGIAVFGKTIWYTIKKHIGL